MVSDSALMQAVEQLGYRVTVGDVAAQAGLHVAVAQRNLMALAADVGANMQVAESGEIAFLFPQNFRQILLDKYAQLRRQEFWAKVWGILFYLIRIFFGLMLIVSIVLVIVAIGIVIIGGILSSSTQRQTQQGGEDEDFWDEFGDFSGGFWTHWGFSPDFFWYLWPSGNSPAARHRPGQQINFLEAMFSFVFGDGDPNANLVARGWQQLGALIRQNMGVVTAEQIAPYLSVPPDSLTLAGTNESYVLPVLVQFNGVPQVSDQGEIIYQFPDLQISAQQPQRPVNLKPALEEKIWQFSRASSSQIIWAIGLGLLDLGLLFLLKSLFPRAEMEGYLGFIRSIFGILLTYGICFLGIPAIRYLSLLNRNQKIAERNFQRQQLATSLQTTTPALERKLQFARQFAQTHTVDTNDLAYTTETDLIEQEIAQKDKHDAEWQRRIEQG